MKKLSIIILLSIITLPILGCATASAPSIKNNSNPLVLVGVKNGYEDWRIQTGHKGIKDLTLLNINTNEVFHLCGRNKLTGWYYKIFPVHLSPGEYMITSLTWGEGAGTMIQKSSWSENRTTFSIFDTDKVVYLAEFYKNGYSQNDYENNVLEYLNDKYPTYAKIEKVRVATLRKVD